MEMKISREEVWLVTYIAGPEFFNFSLSGLISFVPIIRVIKGPIILPQKLPILILRVRKGRAKTISVIHSVDQKVNQVKPKTNRSKNETGPIFLDSPI